MTIIDFNNEKEKRKEQADDLLHEAHCAKFGTCQDWNFQEVQYLSCQLYNYLSEVDDADGTISWMALYMIMENYHHADDEQAVISNVSCPPKTSPEMIGVL